MISVLALALVPTFFVMLLGYTAGRVGIVNNMHVMKRAARMKRKRGLRIVRDTAFEAGIPQHIALIAAAQNCAHGNDERRTAPKDPRI
jgi:hypothetical protein